MPKIAIINHDRTECGVYHHGWATHRLLSGSSDFEYSHIMVKDGYAFKSWIESNYRDYHAFIFNWHPATLWWLEDSLLAQIPKPKFILTGHDTVSSFNNVQYHFICDPTIPPGDKHGGVARPLIVFDDIKYSAPESTTLKIGSFGFGQTQKQYPDTIRKVSAEFSEPVIVNIHMPYGDFVDQTGRLAAHIERECRAACGPNVQLNIVHDYMPDYHSLISWLNKNDINVFNYMEQPGRGCSSSIDAAIVAQKPWACNANNMYRHVRDNTSVLLEHNKLKDIVARGIEPSKQFMQQWNQTTFINDHEQIIKRYL